MNDKSWSTPGVSSSELCLIPSLMFRDEEPIEKYGIQNGQTVHRTSWFRPILTNRSGANPSSRASAIRCCIFTHSDGNISTISAYIPTDSNQHCRWDRSWQSIFGPDWCTIRWICSITKCIHVWSWSYCHPKKWTDPTAGNQLPPTMEQMQEMISNVPPNYDFSDK